MPVILNAPPEDPPWSKPRFRGLPGTEMLDPADWLLVADTYAAQMAERERLIAARPEAVIAALPGSDPAVAELFDMVLGVLEARVDFIRDGDAMLCPEGRRVTLDRAAPLATLGRLVQEDLCVMERGAAEYVLTAAVLCFPQGWTLAEKIGRPMTRIHGPVAEYDEIAAKRVGRLFEGLQPGRPIQRANGGRKADAELFQPETEAEHHAPGRRRGAGRFYRSERQCLLRLPETRAIVFSIHTMVWEAAELDGLPE